MFASLTIGFMLLLQSESTIWSGVLPSWYTTQYTEQLIASAWDELDHHDGHYIAAALLDLDPGYHGDPAHPGIQFDHLRKKNQFCAGSLISNVHVLTHRSCAAYYAHESQEIFVQLGVVNLRTYEKIPPGYDQLYKVKNVSVHPKYTKDKILYDAAIFTLTTPVELIKNYDPIKLEAEESEVGDYKDLMDKNNLSKTEMYGLLDNLASDRFLWDKKGRLVQAFVAGWGFPKIKSLKSWTPWKLEHAEKEQIREHKREQRSLQVSIRTNDECAAREDKDHPLSVKDSLCIFVNSQQRPLTGQYWESWSGKYHRTMQNEWIGAPILKFVGTKLRQIGLVSMMDGIRTETSVTRISSLRPWINTIVGKN